MFHSLSTRAAYWGAVVLMSVLAGCSVGPDYQTPEIELPDSFQQPPLPDEAVLHHYWTLLEDPVLDRLIQVGSERNLSLQEATFRVEEAFAQYGIQRAEFYPDIDLSADLQRRRRSAGIASAIAGLTNDYVGVGGALGWELDIFGRLRRLSEAARGFAQASVEDYHGILVSLQAEIALTYIRYRTFQAEVDLTLENIRSQQESLEVAKGRFEAGIAPELDVRQAESNLGETQAVLPELSRAIAIEKHRLAVLLGMFPQELEPLLKDVQPIPPFPVVQTTTLPLEILRQRPDIRQAERRLAAQTALIGATEAELYPIFSLPGDFTFEALNTLEDAFQTNSFAYRLGPSVRLNLLDFGRIRRAIDVQEARTAQLEKRYRQTVLVAVQEVEDALVIFQQEKLRTRYLRDSVEASHRSTELVKSLYVSGLTDFQNVLDSERTLFSQQRSLAQSSGNVFQAFIALYRALGGGWQDSLRQADSPAVTTAVVSAGNIPTDGQNK